MIVVLLSVSQQSCLELEGKTHRWDRSAELLEFRSLKGRHPRQAQMRYLREAIQQHGDGVDGYVVAVRQVNPLQSRVAFNESVNAFIGELGHLDQTEAAKFMQTCRNLECALVGQARAT